MKISILTLGCRTNQAESLSIERHLLYNGYKIVSLNDLPDFSIINTCSVTSKADYQSRQLFNRAIKKSKKIIVTGCYAQLNRGFFLEKPNVIFVDNSLKEDIKNLFKDRILYNSSETISLSKARPIIKIQEGCNHECSYCVIIQSRGRARSKSISKIIDEINEFTSMGYNEVVITGTNIGQYGVDFKISINFSALISIILEKTLIPKIRLSSIEVNYIDDDLINLFNNNRLCNHLHIPLQSGDNNILKYMNRPYNIVEYIDKIWDLKNKISDISIGSDIITGFPLETNKEFLNTYKVLEELPFSYFHVFRFSRRQNTFANELKELSQGDEINLRTKKLIDLSKTKRSLFINGQLGKINEMIVEGSCGNYLFGTTSNYIKTYVTHNNKINIKDLVKIKLISFKNGQVFSHPII